jgi:hypothetical protein
VKGFNYYFLVLVLSFLSLAAGSCQEQKEGTVLTREEMVRVMMEIYILEDKINRMTIGPDSSRQVFAVMNKRVPERTGIPDSVFRKSLEYYTSRPKEMERIYSALVDSLNLREQRIQVGAPE